MCVHPMRACCSAVWDSTKGFSSGFLSFDPLATMLKERSWTVVTLCALSRFL